MFHVLVVIDRIRCLDWPGPKLHLIVELDTFLWNWLQLDTLKITITCVVKQMIEKPQGASTRLEKQKYMHDQIKVDIVQLMLIKPG